MLVKCAGNFVCLEGIQIATKLSISGPVIIRFSSARNCSTKASIESAGRVRSWNQLQLKDCAGRLFLDILCRWWWAQEKYCIFIVKKFNLYKILHLQNSYSYQK
jgi:hypothetical protein